MNTVMKIGLGLVIAAVLVGPATAGETQVAVAANFTEPAREIAAAFKAGSGDDVLLSFGATGQLYTQITKEAPFDILLSADQERPKKAIDEGFGVPDGRFTYAIGKLALWSRDPSVVTGEETLKASGFAKLSICDPAAAPYGVAAVETMKALKLYEDLRPKLVQGETVTQAFQFVETGNAELGFVALSQIIAKPRGSRWIVPQSLYAPIRQDAVLLKRGAANPVAVKFLAYLKGREARAIIAKYGYDVDAGA